METNHAKLNDGTSIQWTNYSFNPWSGCSKVSPGCQHCYAETMSHRFPWIGKWGDNPRRITSPDNWKKPIVWNRKAEAEGIRRKVFCASMADVFEDRPELIEPRLRLFDLIRRTPALDWLILTKRPQNIRTMIPEDWGEGYENVWLGTSTEDQVRYDERIDHLLAVPARCRFLSAEPLIGPIRIAHGAKEGLSWVIVGGESGPGFRPMDGAWARQIRDDCSERGVTFFFKQWAGLHPKALGNQLDGRTHLNWPLGV